MDRQKLRDIFFGKLAIVRYELLKNNFSKLPSDFFKTSIPNGETFGKLSYREIDLHKEFPKDLDEFLKIYNLNCKVTSDSIIISQKL